ncbi:hypothetical protein O3G_MSEX010882 [Manduca sexta]|uniref:Beta-hexosaminidase n=2 Tax=Manduca sexta TaxID=7130 RepID=A0A922CU62_MANSE|nr:hypothetical protein O3G_MSEX010882 [Manduca sexta]
MFSYLFFIFLTNFRISHSDLSKNLPLWTWECVNERCAPSRPSPEKKLQSLETCNMLCSSMHIWPQPTGPVSLSSTAVPVRADFFQLQILTAPSKSVREHLQKAFELLKSDLKKIQKNARGFEEWRTVNIRVFVNESSDPRMRIDTNERYKLFVRPKFTSRSITVDISAQSFCGARHGFETLLQLIWLDPYAGCLLMLEAADVEDAPRFKYRGLLMDTARNYFPIGDLIRTIDGMAASKLNTFHWHISDSQAFPLRLVSTPQLSELGAYSNSDIYTTKEVHSLVRRATLRGIRVLIEVDTPAHVGYAWNWGSADIGDLLLCIDSEPWSDFCHEPPCGQLNPRNPHVYEILERIYAEIIQLTGVDDLFHLGGDEVSERCWAQHFNYTDPLDLWVEYTRSSLERLEYANGKLPNLTLLWTSPLSERIKTDMREYIRVLGLQVRNTAWVHKQIIGLRTIFSHEDNWDLNNGMGMWHESNGGAPYNSWQRVYEHRPWVRSNADMVEGGEATVWSSVLSEDGLDGHLWPRTAALAERLWTDRAEGATRPVHARLDVHRSRLIARGSKPLHFGPSGARKIVLHVFKIRHILHLLLKHIKFKNKTFHINNACLKNTFIKFC